MSKSSYTYAAKANVHSDASNLIYRMKVHGFMILVVDLAFNNHESFSDASRTLHVCGRMRILNIDFRCHS